MDRETGLIHQQLISQWDEVKIALERMNSAAEARPSDGWRVFQPAASSADIVQFDVRPVAFNLPERADDVNTDLFVVIEGQLAFRRDFETTTGVLPTHSFATRAAYFHRKGDRADHVYGAHYDFALNDLGHPVFHAQMRSFHGLWEHVAFGTHQE